MQTIYQILNTLNEKSYIGSSVNFKTRKAEHLRDLRSNKHHSKALQRAVNKYGIDNFIFKILEVVEKKQDLIKREQHYLDSIKPEYNTCKTAYSMLGFKKSEEDNRKNSIRNTGFGNGNAKLTPENIEEMRKLSDTLSNSQLAERFGVHETTIERARRRYGIKKTKAVYAPGSKDRIREAAKNNYKSRCKSVYRLNEQGERVLFESMSEAARSVNRTSATIYQAIMEGRPCNGVMFYLEVVGN